jgi:hypothetical protein
MGGSPKSGSERGKAVPGSGMAPHVARAVGTVQAKQLAAGPSPMAPVAPHLAKALYRPAPASPPAQAKRAGPPALAPHVARAVAGIPSGAGPGRLAAHLAAAQARMAPPAPAPAAHVAAALRGGAAAGAAVQAMKRTRQTGKKDEKVVKKQKLDNSKAQENTKKRKEKIEQSVGEVNRQIFASNKSQPDFFKYVGTGIPTQPIDIRNLGNAPLKLDEESSGFSNLAFSIKNRDDVGPEVQLGLVSDPRSSRRFVRASANEKGFNDTIRSNVPKSKKLQDYYREALRSLHVRWRCEDLQKNSQHLSLSEIDQILLEAYQTFPDDEDSFLTQVNFLAGYKVHKKTRKLARRQRSKSTRKLAYESHKDLELEVIPNEENFHAESGILHHTSKNSNEVLEKVVGTKVPCVSCTAFFHGKNVPSKILNHTSGAWLSEPSMKQLGFKPDEIEKYLLHIHSKLGNVLVNRHVGSNGEITVKQQTIELDPSSDSEDEDAIVDFDIEVQTTKKGEKLLARVESFMARKFQTV